MAEVKKDQLLQLLCEAGASKEEISTMLKKFDDKHGTGCEAGASKEEISTMLKKFDDKHGTGGSMGGSMTDASKRRHVSDEDGFSLVSTAESSPMSPTSMAKAVGYVSSSDPGFGSGGPSYAPPMATTTMGAPFKMAEYNPMLDPWQGDQAFPMPRGIDSLEQWGRVVCKMEGHRDIEVRGKTFNMLLNESYTNPKMKKYLIFICKKFKHAVSDQPESQGPDLAAFCLRCH